MIAGDCVIKRMTKASLLFRLEQLRELAEQDAIQPVYKDAILDVLLDYIGDKEIRDKVEATAL